MTIDFRPLALLACLCLLPLRAAHAQAACDPAARCYDAGPFTAEVTGVVTSWDRTHHEHFVRLNLRFSNTGKQPLILAWRWRSSASVTDNYGNAYGIDTRFPERISGIGIVSHDGANPSFQLAPGASRSASLVFSRSPGKSAVGNLYTADFSVVELQPIPGNNQLNVGSQYSLNYTKLSADGLLGSNAMSNGAEKVNDITQGITTLLNAFSKKKQ